VRNASGSLTVAKVRGQGRAKKSLVFVLVAIGANLAIILGLTMA
jgi:hypothetical protein